MQHSWTDLWLAAPFLLSNGGDRGDHSLRVIGGLRPDIAPVRVQSEMSAPVQPEVDSLHAQSRVPPSAA